MTEKEKLYKTKKNIKVMLYLSIFYFILTFFIFVESFFINKEQNLSFVGGVAIFLYALLSITLAFIVINLYRLNNPKTIRRKAIRDFDERLLEIHHSANSSTFRVLFIINLITMIVSIPLNSLDLFTYSIILLFIVPIIHTLIKVILKKRL
mgnify:CR=1 FL=1|jgi:hypothetical protein